MAREKSTKIIELLALMGVGAYLYKTKDAPEKKKLEGFNIEVDPVEMCENLRPLMGDDPNVQEKGINIAKNIIHKLLSPKMD